MSANLDSFRTTVFNRSKINSIYQDNMTSRNNYRNNRPTATSMDDVVPPRPKRSIKPAAKPTSPENNPVHNWGSLDNDNIKQSSILAQPSPSPAKVNLSPTSTEYTQTQGKKRETFTRNSSTTKSSNSQRSSIDLSNQQKGWSNSWQNFEPVNQDHSATGNPGAAPSPSPSSSTKTRSRDHTADPLGFVKYTPATSRFEDIQSEAINSWEEGVDLKLKNGGKSKKRVEWLSESAFFSNEIVSPKSENELPQQIRILQRPPASESSAQPQQAGNMPQRPPSIQNDTSRKQSYAEVVDKKTPAWAVEDNEIASMEKYTYQQAPSAWAPTMVQPPAAHRQQMTPVVMMPSSYMSGPSGYHHHSILMQSNGTSAQDTELLLYFYSIIHQPNDRNSISTFQKKIEPFIQQYLHEMSNRTFGLFLHSLVITMDYEYGRSKFETSRKLFNTWTTLIHYFRRFTQNYAQLPEDLHIALSFSATMVRFFPKIAQDLPIPDILRIYDNVKKLISSESNTDFIKLLRSIKAIPAEDSGDSTWQNLEDHLPDVPVAETIVSEVINRTNALTNFEKEKDIAIVNNVHRSWPNVNLLNYTLFHFMALRDELVGPIQKAIQELFKGKISTGIGNAECAIFVKTIPVSTTLALSTAEPCIVFKLGPHRESDDIMKSFEEGSLVILLPENAAPTTSDHFTVKKRIAENSMIAQVIRASSSSTNSGGVVRLVSIHIYEDYIHKLNWNERYTMITSSINASSTLSILNWLRDQHVNLKKKTFSSVLTPRILAAKNTLTEEQISSWDEEYYEVNKVINEDSIPDYLADTGIDIACIMAINGNFRARPGENVWPRHSSQWDDAPLAKCPPLYKISPSQLEAVKFALTHRVSVISGAPGTGKTYLASKLAQLMNLALTEGQFHQPILILAKSQSTLDDILSHMLPQIPDMVRFGNDSWIEALQAKQATRLATPSISDNNYRQYQSLERQLVKNQAALNALILARSQAEEHDPEVLSSIIAPSYLVALEEGYMQMHPGSYGNNSKLAIWKAWASQDARTRNYSGAQESRNAVAAAQWSLENSYLKHAGRGILPMIDSSIVRTRFSLVANNKVHISSIGDAVNWPFDSSSRSGLSLRSALMNEWKRVPLEEIWNLDSDRRSKLIQSLTKVLLSFIDSEIEDTLSKQVKIGKMCDEILVQKWTYLCRFNRIIGMTANFAAAHRDWVSTLWPRAVIVDEASEILESTIASSILGRRTEHVVLLGVSDALAKPKLTNPSLAGNPRNLDVSLFERWKGSTSEMVLLEEQWRMHSGVAEIIDQFNSTKKTEDTSLLITAPLASCNENMVDGRHPSLEPLYGITQRAFYMKYQASPETHTNLHYSKQMKLTVTNAEVDEARFVAFFAVYLSQQPYTTTNITVLTVCLLQKYLIRAILRDEVPKRTCFKSNVSKISLDTVEQYSGRQDNFVIVSTATPGHAVSHYDNLSRALTRAKYGLFVIGKPDHDRVHARWKEFATYMEDRQLSGEAIQLTCHAHGDTLFASCWKDFDQMRNGGCSRPCATLMTDGHVCKEVCHFLSHNEIVCQEPCNRIRPSKCTHQCQKKCFECSKQGSCPPCTEETIIKLECGHDLVGICHSIQNADQIKCMEQVHVRLNCEHQVSIECFKARDVSKIPCQVKSTSMLDCGHTVTTKCGFEPICPEICKGSLDCGHKCNEICGLPHIHDRSYCTASCPKQLICGHGCAKGCANPDEHTERCMEKCNYICSHKYKCSRECWRDCIRCISECPYKCKHYRCTKKCYEICDRPPCNVPCRKQLDCMHRCSGLCGEPCPPCSICFGNLKCSISLRTLSEFEPNEAVYMLPECECVFSVEALDTYFENQAMNGEHTAVKLWECPTCQKTIYAALRYNKYIKTEISLVNTIKMRLEQERQQLTHHEREQIISAMNDETRHHAVHNIVGGRWFVCQNQHPYYVGDCGGATEVSKCPECDAPIGGTQHKVVESNRFYGEFDGSEKPAWPGQP